MRDISYRITAELMGQHGATQAGSSDSPRKLARHVYESMLYDIVFNALPDMLSKLIGEGGFISTFMIISSASEHVFRVLAERINTNLDLRQIAQLMRLMAEVHNEYGRHLIGTKPIEVRISADDNISIECRLQGAPEYNSRRLYGARGRLPPCTRLYSETVEN